MKNALTIQGEPPPHWTWHHARAVDAIVRYAEGGHIKDHVKASGLGWGWFWQIYSDEPQIKALYDRARVSRVELMAGELLGAADDATMDPAHNRNRINARQWLMTKWFPAMYGDKIKVEEDIGPNLSRIIALGMQRAGLGPVVDLDSSQVSHKPSRIKTLAKPSTDTRSVATDHDAAASDANPLISDDFWEI